MGVHLSNVGTTLGVGVLGSSYVDDDELAFGADANDPASRAGWAVQLPRHHPRFLLTWGAG